MHRVPFAATTLVVVFASAVAQAAEFTSDKGFSLEYPDGWKIATKDERDAIQGVARAALKNLKDVDFDKIAVLIFHPEMDEFVENVNVVVVNESLRINDKAKEEYAENLRKQFSQIGVPIQGLQTSITEVGGRKALSGRYKAKYPTLAGLVRQWQLFVPAGRRTYIVTCSALDGDYARVEPAFTRVVNSLEIEGAGGLADFWFGLPRIFQFALIGGAIGGAIGLIQWLVRRPKSPPTDPYLDSFGRSDT